MDKNANICVGENCSSHEVQSAQKDNQKVDVHEFHMFAIAAIFMVVCLTYLVLPDANLPLINEVYIEMAIFLMATIVGFTVARQHNRYRQIMEEVTSFDGSVSAIYRELFYLGKKYQDRFEMIARRHYEPIVANHEWDFNLQNKSTTLTDTYMLLEEASKDPAIDNQDSSSFGNIKRLLADMQKNRKDMISLHAERVPRFQWFVILFLCLILVTAITAIPSYGHFLESMIKAAFTTSIIATLVMLRRLSDLQLFESYLGEHSAEDILNIFVGKR